MVQTRHLNQTHSEYATSWKENRSGAWAGRGFHYQHLFTTLILVRQWAGLAPSGCVTPEGVEDCVVELSDRDIRIQIKSRKGGTFRESEVKAIFTKIGKKATPTKRQRTTQLVVGLEQPCSGFPYHGVEQLFEDKAEQVIVCSAPEEAIIALLTARLTVSEIIAEGLASDLYKLVADTSAENASRSFENRRRISVTEVERRIFERLEAEDPSAVDRALASGFLEPVDFVTSVSEPGFYQGVKAKPGHVASGLVLDRPTETKRIVGLLQDRRHVLITGPSGAGKSALMWLAASSLATELRWFQVNVKENIQDADAIVRFILARRPNQRSPIGLAFDEIGASNHGVWNALVRGLRGFPDVYLLGSVRKEDLNLIADQSDTAFSDIALDEKIAQSIWAQLKQRGQTGWSHWREPFEQSQGLMLEYVHLLTRGMRLAALIGEQVRQREEEERVDELAIIRVTATVCARGGEIEVKVLFALLELSPAQANRALKRLIDEHLVRESRPGVLGGLHMLRSRALVDASHDELVYQRADSLWQSIRATTNDSLPRVIQSVFSEVREADEESALGKLAAMLAGSNDIDSWIAILTGLGLGTLERHVASFIGILKRHGIQRAHWNLAAMFFDPSIDIDFFSILEPLKNLYDAIREFRALPKHDLRLVCAERLPEESQVPECTNLRQVNQLLSCLVPIAGSEPIPIKNLASDIVEDIRQDIRDVAALLSTTYLIGPDIAHDLVSRFGGEENLLARFHARTPWLNTPIIDENGQHGRTVRADLFFISEDYQPDPHGTVVEIYETLIALSPASQAAASDAIDPSGQPIAIGDFKPWSKNMPRESIPAKAQVAWNMAFCQIMLARAAADSLTEYTRRMTQLVHRTEAVFRSFSEKWIKGRVSASAEKLNDEIGDITGQANALAHTAPKIPASSMTEPATGAGETDTLGALLTGILGNLAPRMSKIADEPNGIKAIAAFAGDLAGQAREHARSPIWRTTSSPPLDELAALAQRLTYVSWILHEMAHDGAPNVIAGIVKAAKNGRIGKAIHSAARRCKSLADQRLQKRLRGVEQVLAEKGYAAKCWIRPVQESDSVYWLPVEIAVLVETVNSDTIRQYIEGALPIIRGQLKQDWQFRAAPVIDGKVIAGLALAPPSRILQTPALPDGSFTEKWQSHIDLPFETHEAFGQAVKACVEISAILNCRNLENLHLEEDGALSKAIDAFKRNRERIAADAERSGPDASYLAYLDEILGLIAIENEAAKAGQTVDEPLWLMFRNMWLPSDGVVL
uniref:Uncharacterized protein n=1 Tax=Candidatus Kentrum sp. TUN TaxID=2126343 RepID=A0A450ZL18_9GAMM|nr:MAG: hypothetical protein BECKTUN1418D_GA0071000_102312 [Candidatus Kentron sp. TUN]